MLTVFLVYLYRLWGHVFFLWATFSHSSLLESACRVIMERTTTVKILFFFSFMLDVVISFKALSVLLTAKQTKASPLNTVNWCFLPASWISHPCCVELCGLAWVAVTNGLLTACRVTNKCLLKLGRCHFNQTMSQVRAQGRYDLTRRHVLMYAPYRQQNDVTVQLLNANI